MRVPFLIWQVSSLRWVLDAVCTRVPTDATKLRLLLRCGRRRCAAAIEAISNGSSGSDDVGAAALQVRPAEFHSGSGGDVACGEWATHLGKVTLCVAYLRLGAARVL